MEKYLIVTDTTSVWEDPQEFQAAAGGLYFYRVSGAARHRGNQVRDRGRGAEQACPEESPAEPRQDSAADHCRRLHGDKAVFRAVRRNVL